MGQSTETGFDDISFGTIALSRGIISAAMLEEAVEIQNRLKSMGIKPKRLGEILLEKKALSPEDLDRILQLQEEAQSKQHIAGYEIIDKLGQGGMGAVYKARQKSMDRIVALKILPPQLAENEDFISRFLSEARASAKLNHENIITGIDAGESNGKYYFAMEFADGESVDKIIQKKERLDEKEAIDIIKQITRALKHAHQNNLVHRDVKPQNIILTSGGTAKLCDLGLARSTDQTVEGTRANVSVGTPHYISPEQAKGASDVDIRSDIYSLGATFYHMVTGEVPFTGTSPMVVMTKHLTEPPEAPRSRNPELTRKTSDIILKMMAKKPANRFQTPDDIFEALEGGAAATKRSPSGRRRRGGTSRIGSGAVRKARAAGAPVKQRTAAPARSAGRPPSGRRAGSGVSRSGGRTYGGRRGRSAVRRSAEKNESLFLIIGAVLILIIIIVVLAGRSPGDTQKKLEQFRPEDEILSTGGRAYAEYNKAHNYELQYPYEVPEVIQMYKEVINKYPGTNAARLAQEGIDRCSRKRY